GDLDIWREVMARLMVAAGARPGHMLHVAFGYGLFTGGLGFHDGAERIGMTVVPVSSGNTARHHLLLQDFRPAALCGTPSFVLHIAESLREQGGDPRALGVRYGMFGADAGTAGLRAALEPACGRTSARIARLKGRSDDMLVIKGVNLYPSEVEATLLGVAELEPHYLLVVDRTATLARLEVQVEPAPALLARCGGFVRDHPVLTELRQRVAERLRSATGLSVQLTLVAPRSIPRSEAKAVRLP